MVRIAVEEDEREFRDACAGFIRRYCEENGVQAEVTVFEDGMDLLDCQEEKGETWDILFLDVQMKHCDGFYTARKIREKDSQAVIVFITTLAQYAVKGYEVDAMDYLIKPVSYEKVCLRLKKALQRVSRFEEHYMLLPVEDSREKVAVSSIMYVDVERHTLRIHTPCRVYEMRQTIGKIEEELAPYHFLRCDRSVLVNPRAVMKVGKDTVEVGDPAGGRTLEVLPLSRGRKKEFLQELASVIS